MIVLYFQTLCLLVSTMCTVFWIINQYMFFELFKKYIEKDKEEKDVIFNYLINIEIKDKTYIEKDL